MSKPNPPKLPLRFFRWYCHPNFREDIEGDLLERFETNAKENGLKNAKWRFTKDVIRLFRPGIIKPLSGTQKMNNLDILLKHFSLTFRSLQKNKAFTLINVVGLTTAFLVCLFSIQYVIYELSYDNFHSNKDQIYRLVTDVKTPTGVKLESSSIPVAPEAAKQFPEIQNYTRVFLDYLLVQSNEENHKEEDIGYAEESLFEVFSFQLVKGNPKKVFDTPFNAVISESAALRYFGTLDCIGKELTLDGKTPAFVTGVMKDIPQNSHLRVDIFLSLSSLIEVWNPKRATRWPVFGCYSYFLLNPESDIEQLNSKMSQLVNEKIQEVDAEYFTHLEPLNDLYLLSESRGSRTGSSIHGDIQQIYIFSIIALLVLLVATFNFINISNALNLHRVKEISMKKVFGVLQLQQQMQYLFDAILFTLFCGFLAIILFMLCSPIINELAEKPLIGSVFEHFSLFGLLIGIAVLIGFLTGIFPAFVLTRLKYDELLKSKLKFSGRGLTLKNIMVIAQFVIAIIMIISAVVVTQQLNYVQNKELGYSKSQKLIIDFHFDSRVNMNEKVIKQKLLELSGVTSVSMSSSIPGKAGRKSMSEIANNNGRIVEMYADAYYVDYDFLNQYQIELLAGRKFEEERLSDYRNTMILNESAVKELGYNSPEDVIGLNFLQAGRWKGEVIGVAKDFHYNSLHEKIAPLTISMARAYYTFLILEIETANLETTLANVELAWKEVLPNLPMNYSFADDIFNDLYKSERKFSKLTSYFAIIAISLSLIGLLGLASLSANERIKEMGIRKVLGASVLQLMALLSKRLLGIVLIALAIGIPIAFMVANNWLENFAYRIDINWWQLTPFALIVFGLTILIISSQVFKVAQDSPTKSLKNE